MTDSIATNFRKIPMRIFFNVDDGYMPYLAVCLASILSNAAETDVFNFYVVGNDISEENRQNIESLKSIKDFEIEYMPFDSDLLAGYPPYISSHFSGAALYRLYFSSLAPTLDKILYLDADLIVLGSLASLWATELSDRYHVAAIADRLFNAPGGYYCNVVKKNLGLSSKTYFNSGVMLCNIAKWRHDKVEGLFLDALTCYKEVLAFPDQDILNVAFQDSSLLLGEEWNMLAVCHKTLPPTARVVHWASSKKPWNTLADLTGDRLFWKYAKLTPYYETLQMHWLRKSLQAVQREQANTRQNVRAWFLMTDRRLYRRLFWRHQLFRLLARITFGETREKCVATRRELANKRKAHRKFLSNNRYFL